MPVQLFPSPMKSLLHVQLYDSSVFVQFAFMSHSLADSTGHVVGPREEPLLSEDIKRCLEDKIYK